MRWPGLLVRRPILTLRIAALYVAYGVARALAFATESSRARAAWAAMTVPAIVMLLVAGSVTRGFEASTHGPFEARGSVSMSFAVEPSDGALQRAFLVMNAEVSDDVAPVPTLGTETIWVEGYVSGAGDDDVIDPRFVRQDLRPANDLFARALDVCCRREPGLLRMDVSQLLHGAPVTVDDLLRDGRLELVVGTHTKVRSAVLVVCRGDAVDDARCEFVSWPAARRPAGRVPTLGF